MMDDELTDQAMADAMGLSHGKVWRPIRKGGLSQNPTLTKVVNDVRGALLNTTVIRTTLTSTQTDVSGLTDEVDNLITEVATLTARPSSIQVGVAGSGSPPATGVIANIRIPYNCTIKSWTISADVSGSAVVDVRRATYAGFPTTSSIAGSDKPTLSSAQKNTDTTLTGWGSTALHSGDFVQFNLNSVTTCTEIFLTLQLSVP